jgi:hypothetical protein
VTGTDYLDLPPRIREFLTGAVARRMSRPGADPRPGLDELPVSMPAGRVLRLCEGGPYGWLLDARADRVGDRVALEVMEDSRIAGTAHYLVWEDGSVEPLPAPQEGMVFPADSSEEDEKRIRQDHFAHNRAVYERLAERGFRLS